MYNNYNNGAYPPAFNAAQYERSLTNKVSATMKRVYLKMTLGLIVTAVTALLCASTPAYINFFLNNTWLMWVLIIAEFGMVFAISGAAHKMSSVVASLLFYLFAVVNGMMFFTIFHAYSPNVIVKTFFITAGTFGAMSVYGYFTDRDLSRIGSYLFMALIGLIIASVVNIWMESNTMEWIISIAGIFIFIGLTAWDTQKIKQMAQLAPNDKVGHLATIGALTLYLDFINLFLYLLRFFGNSRD